MTRDVPVTRLQDLPHRAARFCLDIERFCRNDLSLDLTGASLLVAYSGGADSKALLLALHFLSPRLGLTVQAAILNHGLRPEATGEVADAETFCRYLGIRLHTAVNDVAAYAAARGIGLEEAGRMQRHIFWEETRAASNSQWIATGHQLNDLAEDCLMRMLRGTGWPALAGMAGRVDESRIIRPLLLTSRAAIETFLRDAGETWHNDAMNEDPAYFRNRVRGAMLPLFLKENPAFLDTVADRWRMARDDATFLQSALAGIAAQEREQGVFLSRDTLTAAPTALRMRKYMDILAELGPGQATAGHLAVLDDVWRRNEGGKTIQFPGGKTAVITEGGILFSGKSAY